jgi:hypothetical protein
MNVSTQGPISWTGRPEQFTIRCPRCGGRAIFDEPFEFYAERKGVPDSKGRPIYRWGGWYVVEKYPAILPWAPPRGSGQFLSSRSGKDTGGYTPHEKGVVRCLRCHHVAVHALSWPNDAYYHWDIRGFTLWAWSREHDQILLEYLGGTERDPRKYPGWKLGKLPQQVISAKVRDTVVKQISRTLLAEEDNAR